MTWNLTFTRCHSSSSSSRSSNSCSCSHVVVVVEVVVDVVVVEGGGDQQQQWWWWYNNMSTFIFPQYLGSERVRNAAVCVCCMNCGQSLNAVLQILLVKLACFSLVFLSGMSRAMWLAAFSSRCMNVKTRAHALVPLEDFCRKICVAFVIVTQKLIFINN